MSKHTTPIEQAKHGQVFTSIGSADYVQDPLALFKQLTAQQSNCLLLESAEIIDKKALKSLLLIDSAVKIICNQQSVTLTALSNNGEAVITYLKQVFSQEKYLNIIDIEESTSSKLSINFIKSDVQQDELSRLLSVNPMQVLRELQHMESDSDHPFSIFVGGTFAFDLIELAEQLPTVNDSENSCSDYVYYLAETLVIIDHQQQQTQLIANTFGGNNSSYNQQRLNQRLAALQEKCSNVEAMSAVNLTQQSEQAVDVNISDEKFCQQVETLKHHIRAGDIFQVVPSRTFSLDCNNAINAYQVLKQTNPSPYMFFVKDEDFALFGASPESALKYTEETRQVELYPIAGTRPRGFRSDGSYSADLDGRIELELRNDEKEKAEHLMLVDLARNDIARVSKGGTRYVAELLKVDRYSHVMHLVSRVVGTLSDKLDSLHAYQACMNMGTLSGAPKVKATSLIRSIEGKRRGSYGGAVGYINGHGDMDTCIVIRSAFVKNNKAYIQAGAGVVYDSIAQAEADETRQKAQAVIKAVQIANAAQQSTSASQSKEA